MVQKNTWLLLRSPGAASQRVLLFRAECLHYALATFVFPQQVRSRSELTARWRKADRRSPRWALVDCVISSESWLKDASFARFVSSPVSSGSESLYAARFSQQSCCSCSSQLRVPPRYISRVPEGIG